PPRFGNACRRPNVPQNHYPANPSPNCRRDYQYRRVGEGIRRLILGLWSLSVVGYQFSVVSTYAEKASVDQGCGLFIFLFLVNFVAPLCTLWLFNVRCSMFNVQCSMFKTNKLQITTDNKKNR